VSNCPYPAMLKSSKYHCRHDADLQGEYGPQMTCEVYWTAFYEQDGACGACLRPWRGTPGAPRSESAENRLSVDHEHVNITNDGAVIGADGPFRGLLCQPCNRLLSVGVVSQVRQRVDENVIALPGGDMVTASQCAYVRNPPGAGLGIWITQRRRPVGTPREQAKAPPLQLRGPSVRDVFTHPTPRRYVHTRPVPLIDPTAPRPVWACTCGVARGIPGKVAMPDWCALHREPVVVPEPEPEPELAPMWVRATGTLLRVFVGALAVCTVAVVVWTLLPYIVTAALLLGTGLVAARA
jgi:hypothetical protein